MRTTAAGLLALALVLPTTGCASSATSTGGSSDDITREDLETVSADNAMEVVSLMRPRWLRARPARTINDPDPVVGVVIDGRPRGSLDDLVQIRRENIERISFLSAADATIRYGTGFTGGAVVVTTRAGGPG